MSHCPVVASMTATYWNKILGPGSREYVAADLKKYKQCRGMYIVTSGTHNDLSAHQYMGLMNKRMNRIDSLVTLLALTILVNPINGQDCNHYQILNLQDSIVQGNPVVSFLMTQDTLLPTTTTGYTSMFFVNTLGDTLNPLTWSQNMPTVTADTVQQVLFFTNGFTSFPSNFNGHLMLRNPDCDIPFQNGTVGIEEIQPSHAVLYPNPSNGWVTISMDDDSRAIDRVEVFDAIGKHILSRPLNGATGIDCSTFAPGRYTLRGWSGSQPIVSIPLMIE